MEKPAGREPTAGINDQTPSRSEFSTLLQKPSNNATPSSSETLPSVHRAPAQLPGNVLGGKHVLVAPVLKPPWSEPPVPLQRTRKTVISCVRGAPGTDPTAPHQVGPRTGHLVTMQWQGRPNPLAISKELSSPVRNKSRSEGQNKPPEHDSSGCRKRHSDPEQSYNAFGAQTAGERGLGRAGTDLHVQKRPKREDEPANRLSDTQTLIRTDADQSKPQTQFALSTNASLLKPKTRCPPTSSSIQMRNVIESSSSDTSQSNATTNSSPTDTDQLRPNIKTSLTTDASQSRPPAQSYSTDSFQLRPTRSPPRTDLNKLRPTTRSPPRTDFATLRPTARSPPRTDFATLRPTTRSPTRSDFATLRPTARSPQRTTKSRKTEKRHTEAPSKAHSGPEAPLDTRTDNTVTVCDESNKGQLPGGHPTSSASGEASLADVQQRSVAKHEKTQDRLDGDWHAVRALHRKSHQPEEEDFDEDSGLFIPVDEPQSDDKKRRKRPPGKRRRENRLEDDEVPISCALDQELDRALEDGAKQHNLTVVNVRNILHEVITNEHVVAMMKAAITETEGLPLFEPKMTRSKLKEVVEKGVVIPTWNLSPIKKANKLQVPQFVDIPLEEEDSSDEEYQPDEEEEDETAEESLLESDVESTASSPRGHKRLRVQHLSESQEEEAAECQNASLPTVRHISLESVPMGPPPPPKAKHTQDFTFMEKLHAVDEELELNLVSMSSYQSLEESLIAFRTRSKRPLKNVPIGQLEAALQAPDITPDMYDHSTADDENWKMWLCSLMQDDVGNEDEGDDDDDPEYNILEDWDEPDTEDLRNDRAVRITKKEVNELMEELFETFQDEMGLSHVEDEGPDDEDSNSDPFPDFNTPQAIRFEEPLANLLTEQHRTVRAQLEYLRMRKSVMKGDDDISPATDPETPRPPPAPKAPPVLALDALQRKRLQQQMQQHVQLLTQLHLLTFRNPRLSEEAETAQMYLVELSSFAESSSLSHQQTPGFQSAFHPCNLQEALQLIPLVHSQVPEDPEPPKPARKNAGYEVSDLPKHMAWVMATRPVFMYPELLPVCAMRARGPRDRVFFTKAEDSLLALGLKHFEGIDFAKQLISKYLLTAKTAQQLTVRIKNLTMKKSPDNVIKYYKKNKMLPPLGRCCEDVPPQDLRPPVEREKHRLPFWIKASLSSVEAHLEMLEKNTKSSDYKYPLILPPAVTLTLKPLPRRFYRRLWRQKRPSVLKPLLIRPCASTPKQPVKPVAPQTVPIRIIGQVPPLLQPAVPMQGIVNLQPVGVPLGRKGPEFCIPISSKRTVSVCENPSAATVTHIPMSQTRMIMPATSNPRIRKSLLGGIPKIKTVPRTAAIKAAPLVHSAPVLFAVPNGALKLVSLGAPCGVLQPVGTSAGVPVTTVLLNPAHMPLSQTILSPPFKQIQKTVSLAADVEGGGHNSPSPETEDSAKTTENGECDHVAVKVKDEDRPACVRDERSSPETEDPAKKPAENDECDYVAIKVKDEDSPACAGEGSPEGALNQDGGDSDGAGEQSSEDKPPTEVVHSTEVTDHVTANDEKSETSSTSNGGEPCSGQLCGGQSDTGDKKGEVDYAGVSQKDERDPKQEDVEEPEDGNEPQHPESGEGGAEDSPKNVSSPTDGDVEMSSPSTAPRDSSSPPGGQDLTNDKDGAEEEEEEDFDDLTQDEDEMSSASEESVLSVPELQETMEKLTWLASERRLSQEADSEENSQEENTEEEEEEDVVEGSLHKAEGMTDETGEECEKLEASHLRVPSPAPVETSATPAGERRRTGTKGPNSHRVRNRRGRTRASKDASKLFLLYDEKILLKDPLREQKDMAYARSYLNRVREALQSLPGTYEQFLNIIYEFETSSDKKTAVDLYESLQHLLQDWPQLLRDFAAFLLPEQALECGLFEEQQAFEKSRRFLRQLEICFKENPAHHQKIIKLLQSCAECPLQEIGKLKTQMWQLLKGHHHLQEEFSLFFDQLRPPASRMEDFEVMNWTEDKEYKFDGFEEVTLPEVDEEEEPSKVPPTQRNKRRKEASQSQDKDVDWLDGGKDCPCSCHDGGAEQRLKRCKRRLSGHCGSKACESRSQRSADAAFRQGSAGDGRSLLKSSAEERTSSGPAHKSRATLQTRGINESTNKPRTQSKDSGRSALRGARRPHASKDLTPTLPEKESACSPPSHSGPCTPNSVENHGTPAEGAVRCTTPTETPSVSLCEPNVNIEENSALQPTDREEQTLPMCAKNIRLSSSGEKVIVWTREADRVILTMCQEQGAHDQTFAAVSAQLGNKSPSEVAQRFRELVNLFQTGCVTSSDEEEEDVTLIEENISEPEAAQSEDD